MIKIILTAVFIFVFALSFRLWNFTDMGQWWDEAAYTSRGYRYIELLKARDLGNPFWYIVGSDHPPFSTYIYGLASYKDFVRTDTSNKILPDWPDGPPVFSYDLTHTRMVSVIASVLSIILLFYIGARFISYFVGVAGAMILSMLPHFLALSKWVDLESFIMLFYNACILSYLLYLEKKQTRYLVLTGIFTGLNIMTKQTSVVIFIFYILAFFIWRKVTKKKNISYSHILKIFLISVLVSLIVWPTVLFHPEKYILGEYHTWIKGGLVPEMIFGRLMGARSFFYVMAYFVTTPLLILALSIWGIKESFSQKKNWILPAVVIWFFVPFFLSAFHFRQHMVRYIIEFYAPMSLLAAVGIEFTVIRFTKDKLIKYLVLFPILLYLFFILRSLTPYYLAYYNELVGGTKNVYEKRLFFIGWHGEGLRSPGLYLEKNARKNDLIGMALNPRHTLYKSPNLRYETFDPKKKYDFVVVNYFNDIRLGFDEGILRSNYILVYSENADGANIAHVYQHK